MIVNQNLLNMKKHAKLALICFSMCSLFAFTEAKAQEVITEEVYVEEAAVEEKESFDDFWEIYYSYSTMEANRRIGGDLDARMPQHGIGVGMRMMLPLQIDYLTVGYTFGYTYGLREYTLSLDKSSKSRTFTQSAFIDFNLGGQIFFSKNHKNGVNIFAGFGYDYGELQLSKAPAGYAMVLDSKVIQHAFYVPVGLKFFFGDISLSATYRFRAFDIDMTVESRNPENFSPIKDGRTLEMLPLEIGIGFKF